MRLFFVGAGLQLASVGSVAGGLPAERTVLFLGDSITYGGTYIQILEAAWVAQHPDQPARLLNLGLSSETVSGLSEEGHAGGQFPRPDLHERLQRVLEAIKPDLVVACYGMNDGIYFPLGEERFAAYKDGIQRLRAAVAALGARLVHLTPPVFDPLPIRAKVLPAGLDAYPGPFEGYNEVLTAYADWLMQQRAHGWEVLDLHAAMKSALHQKRLTQPDLTFCKDGIHPNEAGHLEMAGPLLEAWGLRVRSDGKPAHPRGDAIFELIKKKQVLLRDAWLSRTRHLRPGVKEGLPLDEADKLAAEADAEARALARESFEDLPKSTTLWHGFPAHELLVEDRVGTVVSPAKAAPGRPWVWHGEFFGHKPDLDVALLEKGFHVAYLKLPDMLGSPAAQHLLESFYDALVGRFGLNCKPGLLGISRGGLYVYQWALAHPTRVSAIYGDAPVCDFKSWPGGRGKGPGSPANWERVMTLWGFATEAEALAWPGNPVDQLARLAAHKIPLLHVFGDADEVVPWEENTGLMHERYTALGGSMLLIRKPGGAHHPHGLEDNQPLVDFYWQHCLP